MHRLFVGTYPSGDGPGSGEGIWSVRLDAETGELADPRLLVEAPSPSFVALSASGERLYAVSEQTHGTVAAFAVTSADDAPQLAEVGAAGSGGADPCHLVAHDRELWVSNYSSGTFGVVSLDEAGDLLPGAGAVDHGHAGSGPVLDRQEGPHAHSSLATPCGRFAWVMDLGTDEVRRYRRVADGPSGDPTVLGSVAVAATVVPDGIAVRFPAGTGPRHAVIHPSGTAFVVGELDAAVHVVRTDPGSGGGVPVGSVPACVTPSRDGVTPLPSHVALSADATRLYVGVRGPDVVSTFAVHVDERAGHATLEHLADTSVTGRWPRHFAVVETDDGADLVVVANQESGALVALRVDRETGVGRAVGEVEIPAPACVVLA